MYCTDGKYASGTEGIQKKNTKRGKKEEKSEKKEERER
jgi:hypothetical protein